VEESVDKDFDRFGSRVNWLIWERKWNEPQMTRIDTDQRKNEAKQSVPTAFTKKHPGQMRSIMFTTWY